jgi:hypothetical protein
MCVCVCVWKFLHSFMELSLDTMPIFNVFFYVLISLTIFFSSLYYFLYITSLISLVLTLLLLLNLWFLEKINTLLSPTPVFNISPLLINAFYNIYSLMLHLFLYHSYIATIEYNSLLIYSKTILIL